MPITIRHAQAEDIAAMTGLLGHLFAIEADFAADEQAQMRGLSLLLRAGACLLVADEDGAVVGMVSIQTVISTAEGGTVGLMEDLVVAEERRGRGIGSRLLHAALAWAGEQGMTRVQLLADKNNTKATEFYGKHGFCGTQLVCLRITHRSTAAHQGALHEPDHTR
ncbi:GNAT family N-acetyltransferase [Desulfomicrobium escambiense]|uniref:GNAT family N-acetyltransferase n=1 Tax=Desulfomicrobium escambiense TaxID=29503 RepID=UPI0004152E22|nr:GNAT family N-acetyltransferase [Desulfomicrobium escambiense]